MAKNREAIAIYSRKSKFTGKGESIGNQIDMCKEYVKNFFGPEYLSKIEIFEDEGYSGGNLFRPDFQRMMQAVRRHEFKAIIVYRLDRISRNISDFTGLIDELTKLDVSFVSIREQFDTSTPMGRAMMFIISVFSQLERETIAERIRDNMRELAKTGRWLGGTTPTGFKSESETTVTVDGKARKAYKLAPISKEIQLIQYIFDLFRELDSLTGTESKLLQQGIKSKIGNDFSRYSLRQILLNPVYMVADEDAYNFFKEHGAEICNPKEAFDGTGAIMAYNRTNQEKGRSTQFLPISEWIVSIGKHQGVIPSKQWIQTYEALHRNKEKSYRKPRSNVALLTGLIFCECGSRMYPKVSERKMLNGEIIYSYYCKMKERSKRSRCNLRNPNGNILDSAILEQLKMLASDDDFFAAEMERVRKFYKSHRDKYDDELIDFRKELAENERKISGLVDSMILVDEAAAKRHISTRIKDLDSKNKVLQTRISELEAIISMQALGDKDFDSLVKTLSVFRENIDELPLEYKKRIIRNVVRKVVWDGVYVHVYLFGDKDNPVELPDIPSHMSSILEPVDSSDPDDEEDIFTNEEDVFDDEEELSINPTIPNGSKSRWGEDLICYPHTTDFNVVDVVPWSISAKVSDNTFLMCSSSGKYVKFLPLYLHRFRLIAPRKIIEAQMFNKQYHRYEEIDNVPDRLRWCRHSQGLLQIEVADYLEMSRFTYSNMEAGYSQNFTYDMAKKLSDLYGLPERDFMDEFSQFLYDGQAQRIRAYRARLGMGRKPFCRYTGIPLTNIRIWESEQKVISRKSWEKYFKGRA